MTCYQNDHLMALTHISPQMAGNGSSTWIFFCENVFQGMLLDATLVVLFFNRPFWWHFLSKYCQKFVSTWTDETNQARHASDDRTLRRPFLSSAVDRDTALFYPHTSNCALETVHTSTVWKCAQDFAIFFQAPDTFLITVLSFNVCVFVMLLLTSCGCLTTAQYARR